MYNQAINYWFFFTVCFSFRLSSPFVVSGLNGSVSSLQCLDEVCEQDVPRHGNVSLEIQIYNKYTELKGILKKEKFIITDKTECRN